MSTGPKGPHHGPRREHVGGAAVATDAHDDDQPVRNQRSLLDVSDTERLRIIEDVHRAAEAEGVNLGEELGRMMCGKNRDKRLKLAAWQCFLRDVLVRDESGPAPRAQRIVSADEVANLPPRKPDPAAHQRGRAERTRLRALQAEGAANGAGGGRGAPRDDVAATGR